MNIIVNKFKNLKERKKQIKKLRKNQSKLAKHGIKAAPLIKQLQRELNVLDHDIKKRGEK